VEQKVEHCHRINATRYGQDDHLSCCQHPMSVDRLLNLMKQHIAHQVKPAHWLLTAIYR
jgi:BarA-like signal transduction histidine kinase